MQTKYKIFTIDYLANEEFSEEDLYWLFDTPSLQYSLIVGMLRYANINDIKDNDIINICKKDNSWIYKYCWNNAQFKSFMNILNKIFMNLYRISEANAKVNAQMFMIKYGLHVKNNKFDNNKNWNNV